MRKAISLISTLILAALIWNIVSTSSEDPIPPFDAGAGTVSSLRGTTDTSTFEDLSAPSTAIADSTDTSVSTDATIVPSLQAEFVLSEVVFGDNGYVVVRNVGGAIGNVEGYALCQRPNYLTLPSIELAPFEVVWIAVGDGAGLVSTDVATVVQASGELGSFSPADGEMALYRSSSFSEAEQIVSYVEWGRTGHGRSSVAVEAEIWTEGQFIEIPDDAFGVVSTKATPSGPSDWVGSIGG